MWRYLAGGVAALLLAGAGVMLFTGRAKPSAELLAAAPPPTAQATTSPSSDGVPDAAPEASDRTREQKRFDRYDKDRDGNVTREEYLAARRKAFAKLDTNHDGMLSFDEWAIKSETKFQTADADKSGTLTRAEFATTAVKRKTRPLRRNCPPAAQAAASAEQPSSEDDG